ncbi:alpha/beta fold hydrolase [Streptomyces sp. NPDC087440]|uniref:alpha/beta fold hydrolase n=1 Tax=Streptomyces sp. NPDC087440 TaxID=3365790 RepID=UPI003829677B
MPSRNRFLAATALLPALALLATGCGGDEDKGTKAAEATPSATPAALARFYSQKLDWKACTDENLKGVECTKVKVPVDYTKPDGNTLDLHVTRVAATDKAKRRGALLVNAGGPGLPTTTYLGDAAQWPAGLKAAYDVIAFDPRGVGLSAPLTCKLDTTVEDYVQRPAGPEPFAQQVTEAKQVAEACRKNRPQGDLGQFTTRNTARDMDVVRGALGEQKISYEGLSYGTYLGAVFAQMFPAGLDRIVLDGVADPGRVWRPMQQAQTEQSQRNAPLFAAWAAERDSTYHWGATAEEVEKNLTALARKLAVTPVQAEGRAVGAREVLGSAGMGATGDEESMKESAEMIRKIQQADADGKKATLRPMVAPGTVTDDTPGGDTSPNDNLMASRLAIQCGDVEWPRDPATYEKDVERMAKELPYGDASAWNINACAFWDKPVEPPTEIKPLDREVLLLQSTYDASTPMEGARAMQKALGDKTRMIEAKGSWAHGLFPGDCVEKATVDYLVDGTFPAQDGSCTPSYLKKP